MCGGCACSGPRCPWRGPGPGARPGQERRKRADLRLPPETARFASRRLGIPAQVIPG
jgi:hypothetical protein